ncbi:GHKL domain-containing protein [Patescibacteria group bacterium]|nr:GHKL domain-containing protein [Patescibacteria group bacterium]MBU1991942.1 GHKL domain-containing protein [Patescibacteria group bacterium]
MKKKTNLEIEKEIISNGIKDISDVLARVSLGDFSVFCKPVEDPSLNIVVSGFNAIISNLKEKDKEFRSCKNSEKRGAELKELKNKTKELEGSRVALLNILEDIDNERVKAEEEKNKTLAVISHLTDGLLVFDNQNNLLLINPLAEKLLQVKNIEIVDKSLDELALLIDFFKVLLKIVGKEIKEVSRQEIVLRDFTFEISSAQIIFDKNKDGSLIIIHDITREKAIERIKSEFISVAAHQLRTPLSAIKWVLKMALDGDVGKLTEEQYELLNKGYLSNERIIRLVNDLLDVSRIEEGKFGFNFKKTNFQEVVDVVISNTESLVLKNHQELKIEKPEKLPQIYLDKERMIMVLQNILSNAIKYTPEYGKIKIIIQVDKQFLYVKINDQGVGIPEKDQLKVFSKFFRAANVIKLETDGSGLGLFIAKNIIEEHKGKISLTSEEGVGTEVCFSIPIRN